MKPVVDRDLCIGCGVCEDACPEVFRLAEDGLAMVIAEEPPAELWGDVRDSADMCPVDAISIVE